jgi:putative toxin-antitoxin system antitoxin component (TIGR02293 family)
MNAASAAAQHASRRAVWNLLLRKQARTARGADFSDSLPNELAHAIVRDGIPGRVLEPLAQLLEIGPTQLAPLIGVDRTTARRYVRDDQLLPRHSAETVLRLAELEAMALDVFASEPAAHDWLKKEHAMLGESPIDAATSSYGAQRVREILAAIKYGGVV